MQSPDNLKIKKPEEKIVLPTGVIFPTGNDDNETEVSDIECKHGLATRSSCSACVDLFKSSTIVAEAFTIKV